MNDRSSFTQTTLEVTTDVVALAALSAAIEDAVRRLEGTLKRTVNEERRTGILNNIENLRAAEAAIDPLYREALRRPLYTAEHNASINRALAQQAAE